MKEKEIKKKIEELQKQLREKQKKKVKKVVINEFLLSSVLYVLALGIMAFSLEDVITFATALSTIGSLTLLLGLSWLLMMIIKSILEDVNK